jgi:hypothetical protein
MSLRRLTCSDHAIRQAAASQSSGVVGIARDSPAQMPDLIRAYLARQQNWPATHEYNRHKAATELLANDVAAGRARIERPHFAKFNASIAKQQLDWAWHHSPDCAGPPDESERIADGPADGGFSARTLWLGGIAFALLAAGMISAVATFQSSRPLPFETWAWDDLMQRAEVMPGATSANAMVARQLAGARVVATTVPDHEPGEVDAALGSHARLERSDIVIAGLGPILASAAAAERLAADLRLPPVSVPTAKVGTGAERVLHEPPRPVFIPMLVSLSRGELDEPARPPSRP